MKTSRFLCAACLILLSGFWSTSYARMMDGGGFQSLQGTCLEENVPCNQRDQWQSVDGIQIDESIAEIPLADEDRLSLIHMREEEKLARDIYSVFYDQWGTPVFANIMMSEQQHMTSIWNLMQFYEIPDSATDTPGTFNDAALQDLYNDLVARGSVSQAEALFSGAYVEEIDILDLQETLATTTNEAIIMVYSNLLAASQQHLRSFVNNIENLGLIYTAQVLDPDQVTEILNGENQHGSFALSGGGRMNAVSTQFQANLSTDTGKRGNRIAVTTQERLNINMLVTPDRAHRGQFAEFMTYASYTPEGSQEKLMFMRNEQNAWQVWNGDLASLEAAQPMYQLRVQNRFAIHEGQLAAPGSYQVYAAYRLQDGTLVMCGAPVEFTVE